MYLPKLLDKVARGERLAALTCYDASFARLMVRCGIDILLVGDSLGMTIQGHATTLPVTLAHMVYHTEAVARGAAGGAFVLADLPFASYQASPVQAYQSAARLIAAGANMVKLEGAGVMAPTVRFITERGIPVCAHLGLMPQAVNVTGYAAQGRDAASAERLLQDAEALAQAGAQLMVLERIPSALAAQVTQRLDIPTIGIGAGPYCTGQVLVLQDVLGLTPKPPPFARDFLSGAPSLEAALCAYARAVRAGEFPGPEHCI